MVSLGHPMAAEYLKLRAFFDSLKYCCNSSARFFSFKSPDEYAEYWAPSLQISHEPRGFAGFYSVWPADSAWEDYIKAAAKGGWPAEVAPELWGGSWLIRTYDRSMAEALKSVYGKCTGLSAADMLERRGLGKFDFHTTGTTPKLWDGIFQVLKKYHKAHILPQRTAEDVASDLSELPMAEKIFARAKVKKVTVTARLVTVPLVPMGAGADIILPIAEDLLRVVDKGFPFRQAKGWFKSFLNADTFGNLEQRYEG